MAYSFNPFSGSLDDSGTPGIPDAPLDGNVNGRKNGNWLTHTKEDLINAESGPYLTLIIDGSNSNAVIGVEGDIGDNAFSYNANLLGLQIGRSCTNIGSYAFFYCTNLTGPLTIPDSVTSIGNWAFLFCSNITNVNCYIEKTIIDSATGVFISSGITTLHARSTDGTWTEGPGQSIGGVTVEVFKDL